MLNGYRTLAATGRILGVSPQRVLDLIERGPLVGRRVGGDLKVHDDDLTAFRRPLSVASCLGGKSTFCKPEEPNTEQYQQAPRTLQDATVNVRGVDRATSASKAFRALMDLVAVAAAGPRFDALVTPGAADRCLLWLGSKSKAGYGGFRIGGVLVMAHRYAYVRAYGLLGERLDVDHVCRERSCVNAWHLRAVSHAENIKTRRHNTGPAHAALAAKRANHLRLVTP